MAVVLYLNLNPTDTVQTFLVWHKAYFFKVLISCRDIQLQNKQTNKLENFLLSFKCLHSSLQLLLSLQMLASGFLAANLSERVSLYMDETSVLLFC